MLVGDGANITLQVEPAQGDESFDSVYGEDTGVLVVDTGTAAMSAQLSTRAPIRIMWAGTRHWPRPRAAS